MVSFRQSKNTARDLHINGSVADGGRRTSGRYGDAHGSPGPTEETTLSSISFRALLTTTAALAVMIPAQPGHRAEAAPVQQVRQAEPVADLLAARGKQAAANRTARATRRAALAKRAGRLARARVRVVSYARAQKGEWYQYGGQGPSRWDCSGLTRRSMAVVGIHLARSSRAQARRGKRVAARHAQPGDLVVYDGHVGILSGRWRMVDAPGRGRRVVERKIYRDSSLQFRRVIH
jgi:cell wall-associated NlpC family hydrolase